jgi:hypothetical protein
MRCINRGSEKERDFLKSDPKGPRAPPIERARRDHPKNTYLDQARPKAETPTRQQNRTYIHHHHRPP